MKRFWNWIASKLTGVALWAAEHPGVVQAVVDAATKGQ